MSQIKLMIEAQDGSDYYEVQIWPNKTVWICNKSGEGLGINEDLLFKQIHEWFLKTL